MKELLALCNKLLDESLITAEDKGRIKSFALNLIKQIQDEMRGTDATLEWILYRK